MPRKCKCAYCELSDNLEKVKINKKNIHIDCVQQYEKQQEEKANENKEWSDLYEYLKVLHNAIEIPSFNVKRLREIKKNKNISFRLILNAYRIAEDKIIWFMKNVLNGENTSKEIDACITMMIKHGINPAFQQEQLRKKRQDEIRNACENPTEHTREVVFKKKATDTNDISEFL